jgi:anti-sigma B factor antagonist
VLSKQQKRQEMAASQSITDPVHPEVNALEDRMRSFFISDNVPADDISDGDLAIVAMGGELDYEASPQLRARLVGAIKAGGRRLVLDLSDVTFIDSTAIGVLAGTVARLDEAGGGSLAVVSTNDKVLQIFEITGLDSVISLHSSREEAVSAFSLAG